MELEIENDKEIERLGSKAAVEYMQWHEKELEALALFDKPIFFQGSASLDKRLHLTLRSNIAHAMDHVGGTTLKTRRWSDFLICTQDRVPDYNFITLLRPHACKSYEEQRDELLVVPRLQFILVEVARYLEGLYGDRWKERERMRLSRRQMYLTPTNRFDTIDILSVEQPTKRSAKEHNVMFQHELERQKHENERNTATARRGDQLKQCFTAAEAAKHHILKDEKLTERLRAGMKSLQEGKPFIVLDNVLSEQVAANLVDRCLNHFQELGDVRLHAQAAHRGDDVFFLPLFESDLAKEAQAVLSNVANLSMDSNNLLVPRLGQLALYDGVSRGPEGKPGYVQHLDNCAEIGGEGENYREITAILYLNEAPPEDAYGGSLLCFRENGESGDKPCDEVVPKAGRLVIFPSRKLLHEVAPVLGWKRLALSVWILKDSRKKISWTS